MGDVVGFRGEIRCDADKPDGAPRKLLDISRIRELGWTPTVGLREGIESAYEDFRAYLASASAAQFAAPAVR